MAAPTSLPLFVFGTLVDPDVRALVLGDGADPRTELARVEGEQARIVAGRDYPVLVPREGAVAEGLLVHGLDATHRARLAWFEGEAYALRAVRVRTAHDELDAVLFAAAAPLPTAGPWRPEAWRAAGKPAFLERARTWMDEFGAAAPLADSVVWGHGPGNDPTPRG